ncbi:MAG: hypothetical protein ACOCWF_09240, partial [Halochromatium sp.]
MLKRTLATAALLWLLPLSVPTASEIDSANAPEVTMYEIGQTVLKIGLMEGVGPDDAIDAMNSKAIELNMKLVGHQNVS